MARAPAPLARALAATVLAAGCTTAVSTPAPPKVTGYRPADLRRAAVVLRVAFGAGDFGAHERSRLPDVYAGALVDALNAEAILPVDLTVTASRFDRGAALLRARALSADHALIVDATVTRGLRSYCRDTRRPFTVRVTTWVAGVEVLRAADGVTRLRAPELEAQDVEVDCDAPRESRELSPDQAVAASVQRVVRTLVRP